VRWLDAQRVPDEMGRCGSGCLSAGGRGRSTEATVVSLGSATGLRQARSALNAPPGTRSRVARCAPAQPAPGSARLMSPEPRAWRACGRPAADAESPAGRLGADARNMVEALSGFGGPRASPAVPQATVRSGWTGAPACRMPSSRRSRPTSQGSGTGTGPRMMRQLEDPHMQEQRLLEACRRLLSDPAGRGLVARLATRPDAERRWPRRLRGPLIYLVVGR